MPSSKHFRAFVALALAILPASPATAQQTGLLLVAHGATPAWNDRVRAVAREVRWPDGPVAVAFLMGSEAAHEGWSAGLRTLAAGGASGAVVVPVMVNSNGAHVRQIEFYAGLRAELPPSLAQHDHRDDGPVPALRLRVTPALDAAPELGAILLDGWRALPQADQGRPILLLAHGPESDADARRWRDDLGAAAQVLAAGGAAGELRVALVRDDADPAVRGAAIAAARDTVAALAARARDSVVVIPVLISTGDLDRVRMPGDLAGLPVVMRPMPLAPSPRLARWVERVARASR